MQLIYALLACALQGNMMPWPPGGGQIGQYGGMYQPGFHPGTMHPAPELGRPGQPPAAMRSEGESQNCARTQPGTAAGDMPGAMHWPEGEMAAWIQSRPKGQWNSGWTTEDWRAYREEVEDPPHQADLEHWGYGGGLGDMEVELRERMERMMERRRREGSGAWCPRDTSVRPV